MIRYQKQKYRFFLSVFAVVLFSSPYSFAGFESHGGSAFVCREPDGKISSQPLSVELLDLWEANVLFHLHVRRDDMAGLPWQKDLETALDKLKNWDRDLWQSTELFYSDVTDRMAPIPSGVSIATPEDTGSLLRKKGCPLEGVADYNDLPNTLFYDPETVSAMDPIDYAALLLHETIYKVRRTANHDTDSLQARRIVGFLFSEEKVPHPDQNLPANAVFCETSPPLYSFAIYKTPPGFPKDSTRYTFRFSRIDGAPLIGITEATISNKSPLISNLYNGIGEGAGITLGYIATQPNFPVIYLDAKSQFETLQVSLTKFSNLPVVYCGKRVPRGN
jgi:hypothetical protein